MPQGPRLSPERWRYHLTFRTTTAVQNFGDGGVGQVLLTLPPAQGKNTVPYLMKAVARVSGDILTTGLADTGPVFCDMYIASLPVGSDSQIIQLDKGFMRAAIGRGTTSVVGFVGRLQYRNGDAITLNIGNFTGASVNIVIDYAVFHGADGLEERITRLSTEQEAQFQWQATYTEIATPGRPVIDMTVGAGDQFKLTTMRVSWTTGAAEGIRVELFDDQATPILIDTLAVIASGATVNINLPSIGTDASASGNRMQSNDVILRTGTTLRVTDNSGTSTLNDVLLITIIGLIKGQAPSITDNGTGNKATEAVKYKRVR